MKSSLIRKEAAVVRAGTRVAEEPAMSEIEHRSVETNGIRMHIAEQGAGPLIVLCHGFPESWYSWRHQLVALAEAGFHAVAADMRGYGQTDRPEAIDQYTLLHLVGDMVGLLDALGHETAVIAGRDWGAPVAWHAALLRPDRFRAVIGLSVSFIPRGPDYPSKSFPESEVNEAMLEFLRRLITVRQKAVSRMLRSRPDYLVCSLI